MAIELVNVYSLFATTFTLEYSPAQESLAICSLAPVHAGVKVASGYNPLIAPLQFRATRVVKFPPDTHALFAVPQLDLIQ
ncbi:hypothetical protein D9M72_418070 [compost metagenome]